VRLVLTGQHPALDPADYGFAALDCVRLACAAESDPHRFVGSVVRNACAALQGCDLVIVQGDTSSALGGALAAAQSGIPLAHVEAGLRTHDPTSPWPEEEFRIAIDREAELLFAPTELSAANLRRERVRGLIHVTGNTSIDAVRAIAARLGPPELRPGGKHRLLVTCHRRESWGEGLAGIAAALRQISAAGTSEIRLILHPNPRVAAQMRDLLGGVAAIELVPPCTHAEMLRMMRDADLILSDSGGMQEEAPALGVPLLVLRDHSERPEAIASGNIALVGRDPDRIVATALRLLSDEEALESMRAPSLPYGDGRASERIAEIAAKWLESRISPAAAAA
jgi:UDP-N-acetylglucosamine 2-epimerase (non-hydrolysing)